MIVRTLRWLIALAVAIAGPFLVEGPATAAGASYCAGSGVNVAIDFGALGGGVQKGCGSGSIAADAIQSAGFTLGYIQTGGMSGFVCTVSGKPGPSQGGCTGANGNGYWALFVANPGGAWTYANLGANSQPVSNGQTVSFAWQAPGSGQRQPGTAPASRIAAKPTPSPSHQPRPSVGTAGSAAGAKVTPRPSATPTTSRSAAAHPTASPKPTLSAPTPTASPSTWSSTAPAPSQTAAVTSSPSGGGLPWWIPVAAVIALVGGAGLTWWRRRAGG